MRAFITLFGLGFLAILIGSAILPDTAPQAFAQQCPNGVCP
jgi:hypothetical protein